MPRRTSPAAERRMSIASGLPRWIRTMIGVASLAVALATAVSPAAVADDTAQPTSSARATPSVTPSAVTPADGVAATATPSPVR